MQVKCAIAFYIYVHYAFCFALTTYTVITAETAKSRSALVAKGTRSGVTYINYFTAQSLKRAILSTKKHRRHAPFLLSCALSVYVT